MYTHVYIYIYIYTHETQCNMKSGVFHCLMKKDKYIYYIYITYITNYITLIILINCIVLHYTNRIV